ncbi:MAG: hypothetical protein HY806_04850 [Nitrospirae bacterium]|nr:hypothetical protein [Nitrospirota bacterium]
MNVKKFLVGRGGILITVPALSILWTRYDIFCRHKRRYSRKQLIEHLQLAGFSQIKVRYFMFLPGLILLVKRKINDLLGQNEAADLSVNPVINSVMKIFMLMEYWLQKLIYIPFGSSIYGIALVKDENRIL